MAILLHLLLLRPFAPPPRHPTGRTLRSTTAAAARYVDEHATDPIVWVDDSDDDEPLVVLSKIIRGPVMVYDSSAERGRSRSRSR